MEKSFIIIYNIQGLEWHLAVHIALGCNNFEPSSLPDKLGIVSHSNNYGDKTIGIQIIMGIKRLCLKGNGLELVQGDKTSALSEGTTHQI
jgi:hypothetical protein